MNQPGGTAVAEMTPDSVVSLLEEQLSLYEQLKRLARRQRGVIAEEDPERLLKILAQRQQLVNKLAVIGDKLAPFRGRWEEFSRGLDAAQSARASKALAGARTVLGEILESDEQDAGLLRARQAVAGGTLRGIVDGRKAVTAYAAQSHNETVMNLTDRDA